MKFAKIKETVKTVVIAVLFSAIIAFVAGAKYQAAVNEQISKASQASTTQASPKE